jgi:putative transcriptional regulator
VSQHPSGGGVPASGPRSLKGRLLVASPALNDPNFDSTVVLLLEHGDDGAVGVVLNRPTGTDVADPLPGWHRLCAEPPVVFVGGPVSPDAAICLARSWPDEDVDAYEPLFDSLGTLDLSVDPDEVAAAVQGIRVFVGYAGWGAGQLDRELLENAWLTVPASPAILFDTPVEQRWQAAADLVGVDLSRMSGYAGRA